MYVMIIIQITLREKNDMARPHTKSELIEAAELNYDKLLKLIDSIGKHMVL